MNGMKKCYACGSQNIEDGLVRCPFCNFTLPREVEDGSKGETFAKMMQMAGKEYRKNKLKGIRIGITIFSYQFVNGSLQESCSKELVLTDMPEEMEPGEAVWSAQSFARIDAGEPVALEVFCKGGNASRQYQLELTAPELDSFWHVGVRMEEGFRVCFLLGDESEYAKTNQISLLEL